MCGRFANHIDTLHDWREILGDWPDHVTGSYNVAPTTNTPVVIATGWSTMRWGLVPHWSPEPRTRYSTINARAEKLARTPAYRDPWWRGQRCLVPARGYYEWRQNADGKQPYFIHRRDGTPLMLAGVWDLWRHGAAKSLYSYSIITTAAISAIAYIHARMPLALPLEAAQDWLHGRPDECLHWLASNPRMNWQQYRFRQPSTIRATMDLN